MLFNNKVDFRELAESGNMGKYADFVCPPGVRTDTVPVQGEHHEAQQGHGRHDGLLQGPHRRGRGGEAEPRRLCGHPVVLSNL